MKHDPRVDTAGPTPYDAFAKLDEACARGLVTREEYVALLDTALS